MKWRGVVAFVTRESRGARGRLAFFTACVAIGVAAVVGVAGLSGGLEDGLRARSRELLAADLAVRSYRPLPERLGDALASVAPGAQRVDVRELATMAGRVSASGAIDRSRLCELKVVESPYPLYGAIELDPPAALADLLDESSVVVAPELLSGLDLAPGDTLRLGGADFRIAGVVLEEPDRLDFQLTLGPRAFLTRSGFDRTSLLGVGNRVKYRALVRLPQDLPEPELDELAQDLHAALDDDAYLRIETHFEAQPGVRRGLERFSSFLGLVALLSLVLGGIGVAQVVRSWVGTRATDIAVLRCIGLLPREILGLHLAHVLFFATVGSVVGAAGGAALPPLLPLLAPDLLPPDLVRPWQPAAIARGLGLGIGVSTLFALPALTALWRVPPVLVLQSAARPLRAPLRVRCAAGFVLVAGILGSAWIQGGRLDFALGFTGTLGGAALALYLGARVLVRLAAAAPRARLGPTVAHGLAALARPGTGTVGAIVALGLGTLVVASMSLVETRLARELRGALPESAPSVFLVDVQPDQWDGVHDVLAGAGAADIDAVPVVMARLAALDGVPVKELTEGRAPRPPESDGSPDRRGRSRWRLTREQRLTWFDELPGSNRLVEGELWRGDGIDEVSLEQEFAEGLDVGVGSEVTFDVQGVPFTFLVTSLRTVEWESFDINFFIGVEPGVLDDAPQMLLAAARLDAAREDVVQDLLVERFPNVTMIRIRPIIEKVAALLGRIAFGVRLLGGFTVLAGVAILAGSVAATQLERGREAALLKTLGVTRRGVGLLFATEFALSGLVAGALGGAGAFVLSWSFLERYIEVEANLSLGVLPLSMLATAVLAVLAGIAASARSLSVRPIETLRS